MAELRTHRELVEHGETAIVSALLSLPASFTVLPHLILPGQKWQHDPDDIDVVVLGPNGIFLLEYKHWHGRIRVAREGAWQHVFVAGGSEERRNALPHMAEKRRCLEAFLSDRQLNELPVQAALVFPDRSPIEGAEDTDGTATLDGVPLLPVGKVAEWLTASGSPGRLDKEAHSAIAEHLRPASPRRLVNQYQLSTRLSRTENKTTYLAYDTVLERPVLLQELSYDPYQQPAQLERVRNELLREAKLTMQLRHDHIVNVEHVIPRDDCYYVVTEWIDDCQTLAQLLARRNGEPFLVEEAIVVAQAVAEALEYAHAQGIVHRDIRPENILVAPSEVKVANFGLAKKADLATRSTFDLRQMAQENPYVAPEFRLGQAGHHQVDQRADIFSVGAVLYQLLTGKLPHHLDEKYYEPPTRFNPDVPAALDATIEKALRFDPAQRYSTMTAFRQRLEAWSHGAEPEEGDRYTQRRLVKRTRNSLVFQAFDTKLQRQVGLKKLLLDPRLTDAERQPQLKQLLREAQLASSLVHPHIISVFDHFIEDGDGYIVMEWLEGKNLRELLDAKTQLSFEQIKSIAQQVGEALQYAHSQGVVHRDIKPENIIYHQGQATVLDFGIAHTTDRAQTADIQKTAGTARYMAPEVLAGSDIDVRADIFSLGVVLYELITCQYPYEASVIMARYNPQLLQPVQPASGLNIDCPPDVDAVLARALQVDPELRHPTIAEFVTAFLSLEDRRPVRHRRRPAAGGWPLLIGVSAITFLVFVAVGLYAARSYKTIFTSAPAPQASTLSAEAIASQAAVVEASPTPSPDPTATPRAERPSWVSSPITIDDVTVQVENVGLMDGRTIVTLRVDNRSGEAVSFLTRNDRPDLFKLRDDLGRDYTQSLDLVSVDPQLLRIEAGTQVTGAFSLLEEINQDASALDVVLKEYEGSGRKFPLRSLKLVRSR